MLLRHISQHAFGQGVDRFDLGALAVWQGDGITDLVMAQHFAEFGFVREVVFIRITIPGAEVVEYFIGSTGDFQPMNINFSIIAPLEQRIRKKAEKNLAIANRSLEQIDQMVAQGI
mgnify:CR=1 FL=1